MSAGEIDLRNRRISFTFHGIAALATLSSAFCVCLGYRYY